MTDTLENITEQIHDGIEKGKFTLAELQRSMVDRTKQAAESTDRLVHENPWSAMGIAVGIGVIIGYLLPRR